MNNRKIKGQVAFESLILLLVIITASIYITSLYLQTHDTTIAYTLGRNDLVEQANSFEEIVIIDTLNITKGATNVLNVTTIPSNYINSDFNLEPIENKIIRNTNLTNLTIEINTT